MKLNITDEHDSVKVTDIGGMVFTAAFHAGKGKNQRAPCVK